MSQALDFIKTIGIPVAKATEVQAGDVVGRVSSDCDVKLYVVKNISLKNGTKSFSPDVPRLYFYAPHVGLVIINEKVFRYYIYTPSTGGQHQYSWAEYHEEEHKKWLEIDESDSLAQELKSVATDELFDLYLIQDEKFKRLGSLIPQVVIPPLSILCQTTLDGWPIHDFVNAIQGDLKVAREISERINNRATSVR